MSRFYRMVALLLLGALLVTLVPRPAFAADEQSTNAQNEINNELTGPAVNYLAEQVDPLGPWFRDREELIDPGSGTLSLALTDFVLPGRNGMDVVFKRLYRSNLSNVYTAATRVERDEIWEWVPDRYDWVYYPEEQHWHPDANHWHEPWWHYHEAVTKETCYPPVYEDHPHDGYYHETGSQHLHIHDDGNAHPHPATSHWHADPWIHQHLIRDGYCEITVVEPAYYHEHPGEDHLHPGFYHTHPAESKWEVVEPAHWEVVGYDYYLVNHLNSQTFLDRTYGLGLGWSLGFPVLEKVGKQMYYHDGTGGSLLVDWNSPSHFKEYPLLDVVFDNDSGTFSNSQTTSRYVARGKDGRKTFFASDGRLLGLRDRYGNTITFKHTLVNSAYRITEIIDTIGRTTTIAYTNTQVTVTAPGNRVWTYQLAATTGGKYILTGVTDPVGRTSQFSYTMDPATFSFLSKTNRNTTNTYALLTQVTYPGGGQSRYAYAKSVGNLGSGGSHEVHRVSSRSDQLGATSVNVTTFAYNGAADGSPTYGNPNALPNTYTFDTTVAHGNGTTVKHVFSYKALGARTETTYPDGTRRITETTHDTTTKLPTQVTTTVTDTANRSATSVVSMQFNQYRDLLSDTDALGVTTSYTYDLNFHQLTSVTRPQNVSGAQVRTEYTVNATTGNADAQRQVLSESGVDKSIWTYFTYDAYGNVTQQRLQMADGSFQTTAFEYSSTYGSAYLTRKTETYTDANGLSQPAITTYAYDSNSGLMTQFTDPMGATTTRTYDAVGRVRSITHPAVGGASAQRVFTFDDTNLISYFTDENGRITAYHYDQLGRMVQVRRTLGGVTYTVLQLQYDSTGDLVAEADANGNTTSYAYDGAHRPIQVTYPDLSTVTTAYDDPGRRQVQTDGNGHAVTTLFDVLERPIEVQAKPDPAGPTVYRTLFGYDYAGNILTVTDPNGGVAQKAYDAVNRLVRFTDPAGYEYAYTYDSAGNRLTESGPGGRLTTYSYDPSGRLLALTDPTGGITRYAYDAKGRRVRLTDALGHASTYAYDARDRLTGVTDALGGATTYTFDAVGNRLSATDALGRTTRYAYDEWNRLTRLTDALGAVTTYGYDRNGNQTGRTDALGNTTIFTYDGRNRLTAERNPLGTPVVTHEYDAAGNRTASTDAVGGRTTYAYDGLRRLTRVTDPLGITEISEYDPAGNVTRTVDGRGNSTLFSYDALNRLVSVTDALGLTWSYSLDAYGNVTGITDPLGRMMRETTYDKLNRVISERNALLQTTTYQYDAAGNLTRMVEPDGVTVQYTYDALRRRTGISAPGTSITLAYDALGNRTAMADATGTTQYTYDAVNRLLSRTAPGGRTISYEYDAPGRLTGITDYGGNVTTYAHDAAGRLTTATFAGGAVAGFTYDAANRPVGRTLPGGLDTSYTYDAGHRLTGLVNSQGITVLSSFTYAYDAADNIVSKTDMLGTSTYEYDALSRLTRETRPLAVPPPPAPDGLQVGQVTDTSAYATWNSVSGAVGYRVRLNGNLAAEPLTPAYDLNGLNPQTTYALSVSAVDEYGQEGQQAEAGFTTLLPPPPPAPTGLTAGQITDTVARLTWTAVPGAVKYRVALNGVLVAEPLSPAHDLSGLSASTSYPITVSAVDAYGQEGATAQSTVTTLPPPPGAPTGLQAVSITNSSARLTWNTVSGAAFYRVAFNGQAPVETAATAHDMINLAPQTGYTVSVIAVDVYGREGPAAGSSFTTLPLPPGAPTGLQVADITDAGARLSWNTVAGAAKYRVRVNGGVVGEPTATLHDLTTLAPSTSYTVSVVAVDAYDQESPATESSFTTLPPPAPSAPTGLTVSNITNTGGRVSWNAVSGATQYRIRLNASLVGTTAATAFDLTGLTAGTTYSVSVAAVDGYAQEGAAATTSFTTSATANLPAPANLKVSRIADTTAKVSWNSVSGAAGYRIRLNGSVVAAPTTTSYNLSGLSPGTAYTVSVAALDQQGLEGPSSSAGFTTTGTAALPAPTGLAVSNITNTGAQVTWTAVTGASSYQVKLNTGQTYQTTGTSYSLTGLNQGTSYTVTVAAIDGQGVAGPGASAGFTTSGIPAPTGLTVSSITETSAHVSWNAVAVASRYRLWLDGIQLAEPAVTFYDLSALQSGQFYQVSVAAVDGTGQVGASATASFFTQSPCFKDCLPDPCDTTCVMTTTTADATVGTASHITTYAYDAVGNRVQKTDPSGTTTYAYDAADRLTQVAGPDGTLSYTWDARGNQLTDGQFQYSYDSLNRLTSVNTGTQTVTYAYDGDGLLFSRTAGGETTRFYLNGPDVINEGDGAGTITAAMLAAGGTYAGRQVGAGPAAYYLYNGHGDVIGVVSSGGALASYDYDAFGNLTTQSGSFDNPYLYAGEYYDFTAGLYNLRARFYSPALGRFLTEDTWKGSVREPWTQNVYSYVGNNPVNYVDPTGYNRCTPEDKAAGACTIADGAPEPPITKSTASSSTVTGPTTLQPAPQVEMRDVARIADAATAAVLGGPGRSIEHGTPDFARVTVSINKKEVNRFMAGFFIVELRLPKNSSVDFAGIETRSGKTYASVGVSYGRSLFDQPITVTTEAGWVTGADYDWEVDNAMSGPSICGFVNVFVGSQGCSSPSGTTTSAVVASNPGAGFSVSITGKTPVELSGWSPE